MRKKVSEKKEKKITCPCDLGLLPRYCRNPNAPEYEIDEELSDPKAFRAFLKEEARKRGQAWGFTDD